MRKCKMCNLHSDKFDTCIFSNCPNIGKKIRKPGGGRKLKYGEPCQLVPFKCPKSKVKEFRIAVNKILKSYVKERKPH